MTNHEKGHPHSQKLCDALLKELREAEPGVQRSEAKDVCAFFREGHPRFAYLFHRKKSPDVTVYFRSNPDLAPQGLPDGLTLRRRPSFHGSWEERFPYYFSIPDTSYLKSASFFLYCNALPLAVAKRKSRADFMPPEEVSDFMVFQEGAVSSIRVNRHERNRAARESCIRHWGTKCAVCSFDFSAFYGKKLSGFIHVHHIVPLSDIKASYTINPVEDLRPICPNCHAVIHRGEPPLSIQEVKEMIVVLKRK